MNRLCTATLCFFLLSSTPLIATAERAVDTEPPGLSLLTETADEGFALAVKLARRGVSTTQTNRDVLMEGRAEYSVDPDSLIAASQVIAIHFQTIAAANNYWLE